MKAESYLSRGVSPTKDDVKKAVADQSKGLYPGSFCKIIEDVAGDPDWCSAVHADGAGTKSSAAYLMYRETGDSGWFSGIAQDSLVMNTDDLACIGAVDNFLISNTIGRNAHRIDADCLQSVIRGYDDAIRRMNELDINIVMTGGETADVGDLVKTIICDSTVVVRLKKTDVISAANIKAGQVIIGLSSSGRTIYEDKENSGIGSNGLTAARHLLLHPDYREKYPETFAETMPAGKAYCGRYHIHDLLPDSSLSAGEAVLSPTRTYLPVLKKIFSEYRHGISGLIHCTGGGQVKCRDFGSGIRYVKDNLFAPPPIFNAIMESGDISNAEMYQVFNMGHRMEIYCDESLAEKIIQTAGNFRLDAKIVGYTEKNTSGSDNQVVIKDQGREYLY
jgi:phosphoribosylformylglycinamidine cyclo-ligase